MLRVEYIYQISRSSGVNSLRRVTPVRILKGHLHGEGKYCLFLDRLRADNSQSRLQAKFQLIL